MSNQSSLLLLFFTTIITIIFAFRKKDSIFLFVAAILLFLLTFINCLCAPLKEIGEEKGESNYAFINGEYFHITIDSRITKGDKVKGPNFTVTNKISKSLFGITIKTPVVNE